MPKVSICIPCYKQTEYLQKALDSIMIQDFEDYEIIISDDSPDESVKKLVEKYDFKNRLSYYKNENPLGSPENWNKAVEYANGGFIKILHHDDYFTSSNSLSHYVALLEQSPNIEFAFSATVAINISEKKTWIHSARPEQLQLLKESPHNLFFGNFIGPPSSTIYRNRSAYRYDKNLKWVVDLDFYIQCLSKNKLFNFTKEPLVTNINGANHNVSNECKNNMKIEVFEYLYLFEKLKTETLINKNRFILFFKNLFDKYNVNSITKIRHTGFKKDLPMFIYSILIKRRMNNVFKKR